MTHPIRNSNGTGSAPKGGPASLENLIETRMARRTLIVGSLATAATQFLSAPAMAVGTGKRQTALIDFEPVPVADGGGATPSISADYEYQVLLPWGTPLQPDGPVHTHPPTAENQARQIGIGHDGMTYFPITDGGNDGNDHGVLALNHEFGRNTHVLGKKSPESAADVLASQHAHGVSVVEIKQIDGRWQSVTSTLSRRIHGNTPVDFSGPAAGHPLLQNPAGNAPAGTLNNCANGETPWGTYLTCEENFHLYFGSAADWTPTPEQKRYGLAKNGSRYDWHLFDSRFDLANADFANESNRFGWVVEIDPMDPEHVPVKRTALGRFRHEGAAVVEGRDGRAVVYMGDDARFDYLYKFVSDGDWRDLLRADRHPLDHGTLFVARFDADGTGRWIELSLDNPDLAQRFRSQAKLLTHARIAGDIVGATPMDRPEWTTVAPNGDVYCTLTNNSKRKTPDAANPMAPNADGHIIRWRDSDEHVGQTFRWDIFLIAKNTHDSERSFSDPDGLWADPDGRLFIQTDGKQKAGLNNQLLVADTRTGDIRRLFTGVAKDEITGIAVTPDRRTLFINSQHPGNGDPSVTNFPAPQDGVTVPRDCVFAIRRKNGGIVGS